MSKSKVVSIGLDSSPRELYSKQEREDLGEHNMPVRVVEGRDSLFISTYEDGRRHWSYVDEDSHERGTVFKQSDAQWVAASLDWMPEVFLSRRDAFKFMLTKLNH